MPEPCSFYSAYLPDQSCKLPGTILQNDGSWLCVFHASIEQKPIDGFFQSLAIYLEHPLPQSMIGFKFPEIQWGNLPSFQMGHEPIDFSDAHFKGKVSFFRKVFPREVRFHHTTFEDDVDFDGSQFGFRRAPTGGPSAYDASFREAIFKGSAHFDRAIFFGGCSFDNARFEQHASFIDAEFRGPCGFNLTDLLGQAGFHRVRFNQQADFSLSTHFGSNFTHCQFLEHASFFSSVICHINPGSGNGLSFSSTEFDGAADFTYIRASATVNFNVCRFRGRAGFDNTELRNGLYCRSSIFHDQVSLNRVSASLIDMKSTNLGSAPDLTELTPIAGHLNVTGIRTSESLAIRDRTDLSKEPDYHPIVIIEDCDLDGSTTVQLAGGNLEVKGAVFGGPFTAWSADRSGNTFPWTLTADRTSFLCESRLVEPKVKALRNCIISKPMILQEADMGSAELSGTDPREIDFVGATWPKTNRSIIQRKWNKGIMSHLDCLWDELKAGSGPAGRDRSGECNASSRHGLLAELYRGVAISYERRGRYGQAGAFKAGEYESRGRDPSSSSAEKILLLLYRRFSCYGEGLWVPLLWLAAAVAASAVAYLFLGFPISEVVDGTISYRMVNYDLSVQGGLTCNLLSDLFRAFCFSISASLPIQNSAVSSMTGLGQVLPAIQRVSTVILSALIVFGVRRKTKR